MEFHIQGYLTQGKLSDVLSRLLGEDWLGDEISVPNSKRRWDMAYKQEDTGVTVVEYDGDAHYRNSLQMKRDFEKDQVAKKLGYNVVRFPYWVQLTSQTLEYYFGLSADIVQDFPHGFITTRIFPASFCELGVERFHMELRYLSSSVKQDVIESLRNQVKRHGLRYVLPAELEYLIKSD